MSVLAFPRSVSSWEQDEGLCLRIDPLVFSSRGDTQHLHLSPETLGLNLPTTWLVTEHFRTLLHGSVATTRCLCLPAPDGDNTSIWSRTKTRVRKDGEAQTWRKK